MGSRRAGHHPLPPVARASCIPTWSTCCPTAGWWRPAEPELAETRRPDRVRLVRLTATGPGRLAAAPPVDGPRWPGCPGMARCRLVACWQHGSSTGWRPQCRSQGRSPGRLGRLRRTRPRSRHRGDRLGPARRRRIRRRPRSPSVPLRAAGRHPKGPDQEEGQAELARPGPPRWPSSSSPWLWWPWDPATPTCSTGSTRWPRSPSST